MMEGEREEGPRPVLLDLIPHKDEWVVKDGEEGDGGSGYSLGEEDKLELKLGLPGGGDWTSASKNKRGSDPASSLSLTLFPFKNMGSHCAGAKRGFVDTFQSEPRGYHQHQNSAFTPYLLSSGAFEGPKVEKEQQISSNGNAAAGSNNSPARSGAAPVVGWPPIRSFRKNLTSNSAMKQSSIIPTYQEHDEPMGTKAMLVKINMDGIPIGRKVDLVAYSSYEKLSHAVGELFRGLLAAQREPPVVGNHEEITGLLDGTGDYTLVYEDNEGDRMLVGDVPWDIFISTVKRLRVLKSSEFMLSGIPFHRRRTTEGVESKN